MSLSWAGGASELLDGINETAFSLSNGMAPGDVVLKGGLYRDGGCSGGSVTNSKDLFVQQASQASLCVSHSPTAKPRVRITEEEQKPGSPYSPPSLYPGCKCPLAGHRVTMEVDPCFSGLLPPRQVAS